MVSASVRKFPGCTFFECLTIHSAISLHTLPECRDRARVGVKVQRPRENREQRGLRPSDTKHDRRPYTTPGTVADLQTEDNCREISRAIVFYSILSQIRHKERPNRVRVAGITRLR